MVNNSVFIPNRSTTYFSPWRTETGGLLRVGIKLMMACSTTNIDVWVSSWTEGTCR